MLRVLMVLLVCWPGICYGQAGDGTGEVQSAAPFSPKAAYEQATRPIEITRRATENWSDSELAALKVARELAKTECLAHTPDHALTDDPGQVHGEDLLELAHLCSFAQQWVNVYAAATSYLQTAEFEKSKKVWTGQTGQAGQAGQADGARNEPDAGGKLSLAYDYKVLADLNLSNPDGAMVTAQKMLSSVAYDAYVSEAINSLARYIQFLSPDAAVGLLRDRQARVLGLIRDYGAGSAGAGAAGAGSAGAGMSGEGKDALPANAMALRTLYGDALAFPAMEQFLGLDDTAANYAEVEAALPKRLSAEDQVFIEESRRQYRLLGKPLPALKPVASLMEKGVVPAKLNSDFAYVSVFLLFPDWCNQCVFMGKDFSRFAGKVGEDNRVRFYALLAQDEPPAEAKAGAKNAAPGLIANAGGSRATLTATIKPTAAALLAGTPTLVVAKETLAGFAATDFPLLIVADHGGVVRLIQAAPQNALVPGGMVDQIVPQMLLHWPPGER